MFGNRKNSNFPNLDSDGWLLDRDQADACCHGGVRAMTDSIIIEIEEIKRQGSFLAGRGRAGGLLLQRRLAAFGCRNAASKLVWRRAVAGPKLSTPDSPHEGAADRLRLHPGR